MSAPWFKKPARTVVTSHTVAFGESIISLLLKLHSKLSDQPDSYRLPSDAQLASHRDSRVGNGPHFIGQLLTVMARKDPLLKQHILQMRARLWPRAAEEERPRTEEREARRRLARERQQRLIRQFADRQRQFQQQMEIDEPEAAAAAAAAANGAGQQREYDCVICGQSSSSSEERPFGLVVLLQASSVLAHQRSSAEPLVLPSDTAGKELLRRRLATSRAQLLQLRHERLSNNFENKAWLLSMNIGVTGGVHVQTCGHHIHLDCHRMYVHSLNNHDARQQSISLQRGEYSCPLCRQLANCVLPLTGAEVPAEPEPDPPAQHPPALTYSAVLRLLNDCSPPQYNNNLAESISRAMESMTNITYPKYRNTTPQSPGHENLLLFVSSIARTNLEMEVVQRGGRLLNTADASAQLVPSVKRSCLLPLLTVLGFNAKVLAVRTGNQYLPVTWARLNGLPPETRTAVTLYQPEVPLLLRDPGSLLLLLLLILPLPLSQHLYTCLVQALYNLAYVQACLALALRLSPARRQELMVAHSLLSAGPSRLRCLPSLLGLVCEQLASVPGLLRDEPPGQPPPAETADWLEADLRARCVPFLRLAAVLRQHLYQQPLPDPRLPQHEFSALADYLQLGSSSGREAETEAAGRLAWLTAEGAQPVLRAWCQEYLSLAGQGQVTARHLAKQYLWHQPQLLRLPNQYKTIFLFYHRRPCARCQLLPKEPTICLLCGTLVCMRGQCCKVGGANEAVSHSVDCGAGTSIFLSVNSSNVIVIRGRRACLWGSVYLDSFGEEDRDLKRGRPLYLCHERYQLLENLWVSHAFDNTRRRWIWHKEAL